MNGRQTTFSAQPDHSREVGIAPGFLIGDGCFSLIRKRPAPCGRGRSLHLACAIALGLQKANSEMQ